MVIRFGYPNQAHPKLAEFGIGAGVKLEMSVQLTPKDGNERTDLGGFVDAGAYSELVFVE